MLVVAACVLLFDLAATRAPSMRPCLFLLPLWPGWGIATGKGMTHFARCWLHTRPTSVGVCKPAKRQNPVVLGVRVGLSQAIRWQGMRDVRRKKGRD